MDLMLQLLIQGLGTGGYYVVLGLSFGLIFNTTRVFHFAHGAIISIGSYTIYLAVAHLGLPLAAGIGLAIVTTAIAGVACELLLYRPLRRRGAPPLLWFLASFAALLVAQNVMLLMFGGVPVTLVSGAMSSIRIAGFTVSELVLWKVASGALATLFVVWLLYFTRTGKELRAIVSNPDMARIAGIDVERHYLTVYAIGSALTVPSSAITLFDHGAAPDLGELPLLVATVAVFSGGIGAYLGGALGGLLLGLIGAVAIYWVNSSYQLTIALGLMTLFLLLRPSGLVGIRMRRV